MVDTMLSRRAFFGVTAGGALALYLPTAVGYRQAFAAPIPGGSLSPRKISKFRAPLVVPPAMPTIAPGEYEVAVRQIVQQILPPGSPPPPCGDTVRRPIPQRSTIPRSRSKPDAGRRRR